MTHHVPDGEGYCWADGLDWPCPYVISVDALIAAAFAPIPPMKKVDDVLER